MEHRLTDQQRDAILEWEQCDDTRRKDAIRENLAKSLAEVLYLRQLPPEESREIVKRALTSDIAESASHEEVQKYIPEQSAMIRLQTILFDAVPEERFSKSVNRGVTESLYWHIYKDQNAKEAGELLGRLETKRVSSKSSVIGLGDMVIHETKSGEQYSENWNEFPNRPPKSQREWWSELARLKRRFAIIQFKRSNTRTEAEIAETRNEIREANDIASEVSLDKLEQIDPNRVASVDSDPQVQLEEIDQLEGPELLDKINDMGGLDQLEESARDLVNESRRRASKICFQLNNPQNIRGDLVVDPEEKFNRHWIELHRDFLEGNPEEQVPDVIPEDLPRYDIEPQGIRDPSRLSLLRWTTDSKIIEREGIDEEELQNPYLEIGNDMKEALQEPAEDWHKVEDSVTD